MKVQHDIVRNLECGRSVMLFLLNTSAVFDTINIEKLLSTLVSLFNIGGKALDWFRSYLTGRSQRVVIGSSSSNAIPIYHGVPRGSTHTRHPLLTSARKIKCFIIDSLMTSSYMTAITLRCQMNWKTLNSY